MTRTSPPKRCITAPDEICGWISIRCWSEEEELAEREEEILTTGEAAALCGVSRSTLRRAVAQGHLRAWHTPGKHLRFTRAACLEFAQSLGRVDLIGQSYRETPVSGQPAQAGAVS